MLVFFSAFLIGLLLHVYLEAHLGCVWTKSTAGHAQVFSAKLLGLMGTILPLGDFHDFLNLKEVVTSCVKDKLFSALGGETKP